MKSSCRPGSLLWSLSLSLAVGVFSAPAAAEGLLDKAKDFFGMGEPAAEAGTALSQDEIGAGLKEALRVGTRRVVAQLGKTDGFNGDPQIHIPLPSSLDKVQSTLSTLGMGGLLDDLELRMNRAAEAATPKARKLFVQSIRDMTLDDVMAIYKGPNDAATRYFESKMSEPLAAEMRPIVDETLAEAGAVRAYESVIDRYSSVPFVSDIDMDLTGYVVEKGMGGIFHYLAKEEAAIRQDPLKRTTDLLKRVFGN